MQPVIFIGCSPSTLHFANSIQDVLRSKANFMIMPAGQKGFWDNCLFLGKTRPDIAIYIFDTHDVDEGNMAAGKISGYYSCYNAGLLQGSIGKGNVFFLVPETAIDLQCFFGDKHFNPVAYDAEEKDTKKAVGLFCKTLQPVIKEQQFLLDNGLQCLSHAIRQTVLFKEENWEIKLFVELLQPGITDIEQYYNGLNPGAPCKEYGDKPGENTLEWVENKLADFTYITERLGKCMFTDFLKAVAGVKEKSRPVLLRQCSQDVTLGAEILHAWQFGCIIATFPPEYEPIRQLLLQLGDKLIGFVYEYPGRIMQNLSMLKLGFAGNTLIMRMPDVRRQLREIREAMRG